MPDPGLSDCLSHGLRMRTRWLRPSQPCRDGRYVLYAMSGNIRSTSNQALDVAISVANSQDLPVLVVFELTETYPFASDRHHRFMLEGARDTLAKLQFKGIATAAYVQRPGIRQPATVTLARDSACLVCDDVPTRPYREQREILIAETSDRDLPIAAVDASCVVPMRCVDQPYDRAYKFRKATKDLRHARLGDSSANVTPRVPMYRQQLPLTPIDLERIDLGTLTAACEIDHGVPPVPEFPGGETAATTRWETFRDHNLEGYAERRNDALQEEYVSRLSPYLRHGMIAATDIAREAAACRGKGPEKFLDELLIWREMSWSYAFHVPEHDAYESIPAWARESLARRTHDPRPVLYGWDTLARGRTDDPFWNAAQKSYVRRGYLHNNVRMTWAKELLNWTDSPEETARTLVDLNNRYSLDGGDPNSYSGLFWCLGAFDRPFEPEQPIFGAVRPRSTAIHAHRLDTKAFAAKQVRRPKTEMPRVAVIGAGPAGLICARTLADHGIPVTVFDKGRGVGGRTATRQLSATQRADHGAPGFDIRDARLSPYVESWQDMGLVAPWTGPQSAHAAGTSAMTATPRNRALAVYLASDIDVRSGIQITQIEAVDGGWRLRTSDGVFESIYDRVVVASPAPQAADLLMDAVPDLARKAHGATYDACITAIIAFDEARDHMPAVLNGPEPIEAAIRERAKPGREDIEGEVWVLQATAAWSASHVEDDPAHSAQALFDIFRSNFAETLPAPSKIIGHRWRYAKVKEPVGEDCLFAPDLGIGACGDWCPGGGIEGALLSGIAMAGRLFSAEPGIQERGSPRQDVR